MKIGLVTEATCMYFFFDFGANTLAVVASFFFLKKKALAVVAFFWRETQAVVAWVFVQGCYDCIC
jgi:hypothetical protein